VRACVRVRAACALGCRKILGDLRAGRERLRRTKLHARVREKILDWHSSGGRGNYGRRMANRYQYTVVELREGMIGGKMSGDQLEKVLNEHAAQGWQLKAITSVEVKGRVGPGGVEGLLVTFERPVG
jgi:hypothetical protein